MGEAALSIPMQLATLPEVNVLEFNLLIAGLRKLPHEVSDDLIRKLRAHVKAQLGEE